MEIQKEQMLFLVACIDRMTYFYCNIIEEGYYLQHKTLAMQDIRAIFADKYKLIIRNI
jgi:hypothetical protein